jgi:hypothetical protein
VKRFSANGSETIGLVRVGRRQVYAPYAAMHTGLFFYPFLWMDFVDFARFFRAKSIELRYDSPMLYLILGSVLVVAVIVIVLRKNSGDTSHHTHDEAMWSGHSDNVRDHSHNDSSTTGADWSSGGSNDSASSNNDSNSSSSD